MAKIRRAGFGTVFQVENEIVGIGTTGSSNTVETTGNVKSSNVNVIGIATLPVYKGFLDKETKLSSNEVDLDNLVGYVDGQPYYGDFHAHTQDDGTVVNLVGAAHTTLSHQVINDAANLKVDTLSGDIIIDGEFTVSSGTTYCTSVDQLTVTSNFSTPTGGTGDRIHCFTAGSMRFNQDLGTLEFYTGEQWRTVNYTTRSTRAIICGGSSDLGERTSDIETVNISTRGDATKFGDMQNAVYAPGSFASETRGIIFGGSGSPSIIDVIDYVTLAAGGNGIDFGNLTATFVHTAGASSSTRGLAMSNFSQSNVINYVQIATTGDALDFGDLVTGRHTAADAASPIYAFIAGGNTGDNIGNIERMTISTTGSSQDFGDLSEVRGSTPGGASNSTIAIFTMGRSRDSVLLNTIEIMNMSTQGSAKSFGLINEAGSQVVNATSSATRAIAMGGMNAPNNAKTDSIHSITFSSNGGSEEFGDLIHGRTYHYATSDSHGGLGGY